MNKQIYLGGTPLIDLTGYATESYVDTAIENVDVTDQLQNYVLKTALDASYGALDASIKSSDASITAIKSTLAEITGEGAEADTIINTWQEMKDFVADYTTASDLSTLINTVKTQAVADASADAAAKYQPIGDYVTPAGVASQINSSIAALDLGQYAKDASLADYLMSADAAATYQTKNDSSNHVDGSGVLHIIKCTSTQYAAIETKDAATLYIVTD